jgi:predicted  nucleic acid-binding Zn-ribbon protein
MSRTSQLFELQQVDTQSDELLRRLLAINAALGEQESLRAAREATAAAQAAHREAQLRLRAASHEVDDVTAHLETMSKRLYDGSVKNPKELVALEHDIANAKSVRVAREDTMIEAMEEESTTQAALAEAQTALATAETEWQRHQDGLAEEKETLDPQLRALHTHRAHRAAAVPPADLLVYERIRKVKKGLAVAAMEHDICQGCRVKVSGGAAVTAKQGQQLVNCPSCGRLLHPGERGDLVRR